MKHGVNPETGDGYGLPNATERKKVADAKAVIDHWRYANRAHKSATELADGLLVGMAAWLTGTKPDTPKPKDKSDTPTPESTLKADNPMDKK